MPALQGRTAHARQTEDPKRLRVEAWGTRQCFLSSFLNRFTDTAEADYDAADIGLLDIARGNTRVAADESAKRAAARRTHCVQFQPDVFYPGNNGNRYL